MKTNAYINNIATVKNNDIVTNTDNACKLLGES